MGYWFKVKAQADRDGVYPEKEYCVDDLQQAIILYWRDIKQQIPTNWSENPMLFGWVLYESQANRKQIAYGTINNSKLGMMDSEIRAKLILKQDLKEEAYKVRDELRQDLRHIRADNAPRVFMGPGERVEAKTCDFARIVVNLLPDYLAAQEGSVFTMYPTEFGEIRFDWCLGNAHDSYIVDLFIMVKKQNLYYGWRQVHSANEYNSQDDQKTGNVKSFPKTLQKMIKLSIPEFYQEVMTVVEPKKTKVQLEQEEYERHLNEYGWASRRWKVRMEQDELYESDVKI